MRKVKKSFFKIKDYIIFSLNPDFMHNFLEILIMKN